MPSLNTKLASAPNTTSNFVLRATSSTTIGNSTIQDDGTNVAIGTTPGTYKLNVSGTGNFTGALTGTSATFSSTLQVGGTGSSTITIGDAVGSAADSNLRLRTGSTKYAWLIASQNNVAGFEITPSTAVGGTTFSTPALSILPTGAATFSSSVTAQTGEFLSGGQDGATGSVVRIGTTSTNANARNWGIVNTWDNFGDLTFRVSNAQGGNALSAGATRMVILSSGNVGIGTSSPTDYGIGGGILKNLQVTGSTYGITTVNAGSIYAWLIADNAGGHASTGTQSNHPFLFTTNNTERMRITSGGNVGIGTSSPAKTLDVYNSANSNTAQIKVGDGGSTARAYLGTFSNNLYLSCGGTYSSGWTTDGTNGIANIGMDAFNGGSTITFATAASNTSPTERMRITSGGQIVMGRTTGSGGRLTVDGDLYLHNITSGAGQSTLKYNYTSTGLVTYDTSSRLLKKHIENLDYGLDDVLKMSAKKYKWKRDDSIDLGFIADEMVKIIPEIVFFSTEMTNETTGVPIGEPLSINYDRLIPVLVKAIQEQQAQIEELKAIVATK